MSIWLAGEAGDGLTCVSLVFADVRKDVLSKGSSLGPEILIVLVNKVE